MFPKETKVLILYNKLMDYRIPICNLLAKKCDLTFAYCQGKDSDGCDFKKIRLQDPRIIGPFTIQRENIYKICKDYDVVIALGNIKWPKYATLAFRPRKFKFAVWSLGVSASYDKGYDIHSGWDWLRDIFYKACDACIFYTDYVVRKNLKRGFKPEKMFVANNTVKVLDLKEGVEKNSLLFIGTLYRQKGLQVLLDAYKKAYGQTDKLPELNIIGGGDEFETIRNWIIQNNLDGKIKLHGAIYDKAKKREFFQQAYACLSPKQAGLSVLESLGYGVPFITRKDAITGGEIFNITNGETGFLLDDDSEFVDKLIDISKNPDKYIEMGQKGRAYYLANRTPEIMERGLSDAIDYMVNN